MLFDSKKGMEYLVKHKEIFLNQEISKPETVELELPSNLTLNKEEDFWRTQFKAIGYLKTIKILFKSKQGKDYYANNKNIFYKLKIEFFGIENIWNEAIRKKQNDLLKFILKTREGNYYYLRNIQFKKDLYKISEIYKDTELASLANGILNLI